MHISLIISIFIFILCFSIYVYINNYVGISGTILYLLLVSSIIFSIKSMFSREKKFRCEVESLIVIIKIKIFFFLISSSMILFEVISR